MQQLLYRSAAAEGFDPGDVFKIIEVSARNNPARGVTGFLVFAQDTFLQLIEGPDEALDGLLAVLHRDRRHHCIEILSRRAITAPGFPSWRMERLFVVRNNPAPLIMRLLEAGVPPMGVNAVRQMFRATQAA